MSRRYSGRFSKLLCLLVCFVIGFSFAFVFSKPQEIEAAGAWVEYDPYDDWGDGVNFNIICHGFDYGAKVTVRLECMHQIVYYNIWAPGDVKVQRVGIDDMDINITFTYNGTDIQGQVTGTDITKESPKARIVSYEYNPPEPTATNTPTPTPTPTKKPT